jgi:hypothetical protein
MLGALSLGVIAAPPQDKDKSKEGDPKSKPETPKRGLVVNDARALQGYTLISPLMSTKAYLLDMQGHVVRTWESDSAAALTTRLLENGHLLRLSNLDQQVFGTGPGAAGRLQEFTWEGDLVWDYKFATSKQLPHHDCTKLPNGNVLMIVWEKKTAEEVVAAGRRAETATKNGLLSECLLEVQPEGKTGGKVVWEWHVWDHLVQDHDTSKANHADVKAHPELIDVNFGENALAAIVANKEELEKLYALGYLARRKPGSKPADPHPDWLHMNAVAYNADFDQILVSSPEFNEIWIIDHSTTTAEAASHKGGRHGKGGDLLYRWGNPRAYHAGTIKDQKLYYQHNAHWIPKGLPGEGHVLVFNNGKQRLGGSHSSIDELVLPVDGNGHYSYKPGTAYGPDKPIWSYIAPKRFEFYAEFISGAHRLPNGDTLICSGPSGTIFEVTPNKEIVWKYLNPAQSMMTPPSAGPPPLVEILSASLRDSLKITEDQKHQLGALGKEADGKLQALLTEEQKKLLAGPPGGPGGPPGAGGPHVVQVLPAPMRARLKLTDEQKKQLETLQKETEAKLDQALTAEQRKQLKEIRDGFVNAWGTGGGGGGPPPLGNAVFRSYRYAANYPGFAGKDLTPGKTIEELQAKEPEKK